MLQLHNYRKSSEMVVRGWYLTENDRRDILNSKKLGLGWFMHLIRLLWADMRFFPIFQGNFANFENSEKPIFLTFESENFFQK